LLLPLEMEQSMETDQGQSDGGGGSLATQLEEGLELEGEVRTLEAYQLLLQVATVAVVVDRQASVAAVELAELQNWEPEGKTPTQLDLAGQTPGAGSQRRGGCCRTRWWKQVAWLEQKLTKLHLVDLAGTASGQRVGGAGEAFEAA